MPPLATVRAFNSAFAPSYLPVAIFVGGTSGIGKGIAEAFARHTKGNARIVIVGRNRAAAESILMSFPAPTAAGATHEFVECDATLMKNVHRVAGDLRARIPRINFLVLTPGVMTMNGRNETEEGIDRKLAVHYYARWRFIKDLLPALENAQKAGEDAKAMSVLAAGMGGPIDLDDLGLKNSFSLSNAAAAAPTYNDLMVNAFASRHPEVSFVHSNPGLVRSGAMKASDSALMRASNFLMTLTTPFSYSVTEAGERLLHALLKADRGAVRMDIKEGDIGPTKGYNVILSVDRPVDLSLNY
ncbi:NAD(P)-binding protein [Mycena crocata]|nr:NAD(P)-binding protein [Mycena crocata]